MEVVARIQTLDIVRGFALFGVLAVNIHDWLGEPTGSLDRVVQWTVAFLFEDKSWPLFSFLFGLGFAIQLERGASSGAPVLWIHLRRMVVLFGFGVVLLVLFAGNEILIRYSILGLLLLPFNWLRPRAILAAAFAMLLIASVDGPLFQWSRRAQGGAPGGAAQQIATPRPPSSTLTLWQVTAQRFQAIPRIVTAQWFYRGGGWMSGLFTMFLVGLYVGKRRIYARLAEHRRFVERVMKCGLLLGFTGTALALLSADWAKTGLAPRIVNLFIHLLGGNLQALGYAAGIAVLVNRPGALRWLRALASAGRMPLTNYLAQWLIMRVMFDRFFFGLKGTLGPAAGLLIVGLIFALQLAWSRWWLKRFQFGPAEWLWKTLTYLKRQPMRALQPALA